MRQPATNHFILNDNYALDEEGVFNLNKCIFIDDIAMCFWTDSWIVPPCIRFKYFSLHHTDNMELLTDFLIVNRHLMTTLNELPYQFSWIYFQSTEKTFKREKKRIFQLEMTNSFRLTIFFWKQSKSIIGLATTQTKLSSFSPYQIDFSYCFQMQTFSKSKPSSFTYESLLKEIDKIPEISIEKKYGFPSNSSETWALTPFYILYWILCKTYKKLTLHSIVLLRFILCFIQTWGQYHVDVARLNIVTMI